MAVGKITGEMLQNNLVRDGINLAFETDLLFLDVNNGRVGIKTSAPTHPLHVVGTARTQNVDVSNSVTVGDFTLSGSTIASTTGSIFFNLAGAGAAVYNSRLLVDDFEITDNELRITDTNKDLEIRPNGTGELKIYGDTEVFGNLHATGTITADGNLQLGNDAGDNITFVGEVNSDIIPDADNTYNLGSASRRWTNIYSNVLNANTVVSGSLIVDGVDVVTPQGNIIYVSANGDDGRSGTHQNDTFATIEKALSVAVAGDTVYIYPGTYDELLPLTVPVGVTVKGAGLRSVIIRPDTASTDQDVFLLNGETTVEDVAISGYQYNSGTNTGHAFRFASGFTVTSRSPYIRNVSVITTGTVTSGTDPRGYLSGDAGRGAYIDGSVANAASKEASMLFHSVTFICPGVDAITMTNGVRVEWLNSFTYFATKSMYSVSGSTGFAGDGKTRLRIPSVTGTWNVGNTISYYDTDGVTLLASGVIESISGGYYIIDGKQSGFETITDRVGKTVSAGGNAQHSTAQYKFGTASFLLDGTGDYISSPTTTDFQFGTGDFCIEMFVRRSRTGVLELLSDMRNVSPEVVPTLYISSANHLMYFTNGADRITGTTNLTTGIWYHVAVARVSGNTKLFLNGNQQGSTYVDANNYLARPIKFGARNYDNAQGFQGYLDEIRVSKDIGRYSGAFTPTTVAFEGDNNTVLLLHADGPNTGVTFIDDGVTLQDLRTSAGGTANIIETADYSDFGAEVRSIGSASVYGEYGAYGDGEGVLMYMIGHNFAYIGVEQLVNNDPADAVQANEVVILNRADIHYNSVDHKGDFRVGEYFKIDQQNGTITFSNVSTNISSPEGLTFTNGTNTTIINSAEVITGNLRIAGNSITATNTNGNIELTPNGTGVVKVNGTQSLLIPVGSNAQRPTAATGQIRYNTDLGRFEGYNGTVWAQLGGISDVDQNTYILPESTPNANDNLMTFVAGGINVATLSSTTFTVNQVDVDNIRLSGNAITATNSDGDIVLSPNGVGAVVIDNLRFSGNTITNSVAGAITDFAVTGNGYIRIPGTNGLVIPSGDSANRPPSVETGLMRYNSDLQLVEIWDGFSWVSTAGAAAGITASTATDIAVAAALMLG
jgi:hypothetical protein